ncbi:hypothetical protein ACJX0J_015101, partial [Zea mays]
IPMFVYDFIQSICFYSTHDIISPESLNQSHMAVLGVNLFMYRSVGLLWKKNFGLIHYVLAQLFNLFEKVWMKKMVYLGGVIDNYKFTTRFFLSLLYLSIQHVLECVIIFDITVRGVIFLMREQDLYTINKIRGVIFLMREQGLYTINKIDKMNSDLERRE